MCEALDVSESGYHARAARSPSAARQRHDESAAAIEVIHAEVRGRYGSPRMTAELNARGHACSEDAAAERMKLHGIRARTPRRFVRTTDPRHDLPVSENVLDRASEPAGRAGERGDHLRHAPGRPVLGQRPGRVVLRPPEARGRAG